MQSAGHEKDRLIPENYYNDVKSIYEQLPQKHAEKQASLEQQEFSLKLLENTPYIHFYNVFTKLNTEYGPNGDYSTKYLGQREYIRCRYPDIFTRRQPEFSGGCSMQFFLQDEEHNPGDIFDGVYPAVKIPVGDSKIKFTVLGEGPYEHTFPVLLDRLSEQKVSVLISIGPAKEGEREKYFDYMSLGKEISAKDYLSVAVTMGLIPDEIKNAENGEISIKFYQYVYPKNNNIFYFVHIPNWKDLSLPVLTDKDKQILAYDMEYGANRFYHCSAGVGRSVTLIMMRMAYDLIFKNNLNPDDAIKQFEVILKGIKEWKPRAGEWWQLLLALGLAEDVFIHMSPRLGKKNEESREKIEASDFLYKVFVLLNAETDLKREIMVVQIYFLFELLHPRIKNYFLEQSEIKNNSIYQCSSVLYGSQRSLSGSEDPSSSIDEDMVIEFGSEFKKQGP